MLVLLNKYQLFESYVKNNINRNSLNCSHLIKWKPYCSDEKKDIISKYEQSTNMSHFRKNTWLDCDSIIELIKYKIKMLFEAYQISQSQWEQNILVCDLLYGCDNVENDIDMITTPLNRVNMKSCEKLLCLWIFQEEKENVLTKDLINLILKYCNNLPFAFFGQVFGKMTQLCEKYDLIHQ